MDYFHDLNLIWGDEYPNCRARIDQRFEDICSIQLSLGGPLYFGINRNTLFRTEGPLFFWHHPSESYQYGSLDGGTWHHLWVSFRGPQAMRLIERGFMPLASSGYFSPSSIRWVKQAMRELIVLARAVEPNRSKAVLLLEEILVWAEAEIREKVFEPPESIQKVREIAETIRARPDRKFNFPRIAAKAGLSFSHFRALFREVTGTAPLAYALRRVLERAADDLTRTNLTIGEVAVRAGYPDQAQFSKAFKKCMGFSPKAFRMIGNATGCPETEQA